MKTHARAVVIGGGICGVSLLYHFTKLGWTDVVLLEKAELTAGSTWHAAGNTPQYDTSLNMMRMIRYSTELYDRLEAETGQPTGFEKCGPRCRDMGCGLSNERVWRKYEMEVIDPLECIYWKRRHRLG